MKYLQLCTILFIVGSSLVEIHSHPIENPDDRVTVLLDENIQADLPGSTDFPDQSIVAPVPLTLINMEDADKSSADATEEYHRSSRGLGLSGFGGLGGLGNKFNGLGLGLQGFGGLGGLGLGGIHGFGLGGYKPFFGHYFG